MLLVVFLVVFFLREENEIIMGKYFLKNWRKGFLVFGKFENLQVNDFEFQKGRERIKVIIQDF